MTTSAAVHRDATAADASPMVTAKPSRAKKLGAGALSGIVSALAFQPLDVLRTHQQGAFGSARARDLSAPCRPIDKLRSMWRGTSATVIRVAGGAGLYFTTLDHCLSSVPNTAVNTFLSGAFARTFAGGVMSPFTIIKARMEWQPAGTYSGNMQVLRHVLKEEGPRGLYRGMLPTLARDVPFSGLYVLIYKRLQSAVVARQTALPAYVINFSSGVVAGVLATTVVHPADVVKTRMQLAIVQGDRAMTNSLNVRATVLKIWHEEGAQGFAKGIAPRVLKRTLSTAVTWTIYEHLHVR